MKFHKSRRSAEMPECAIWPNYAEFIVAECAQIRHHSDALAIRDGQIRVGNRIL